MSLKSRIDRLAHRLGTDAPVRMVVFYGPRFPRHEIRRAGDMISFGVPCSRDADPMEHLSAEQRTLIDSADSVVYIEAVENPRDRPGFFPDSRDNP
jgi:hypothetical protein